MSLTAENEVEKKQSQPKAQAHEMEAYSAGAFKNSESQLEKGYFRDKNRTLISIGSKNVTGRKRRTGKT